jgi:diguanylate cyclase (GGDEF)-like protein/PAS domain S-box-containing protein
MKIITRLLFLFALVAVVPLALFGYINLRQDEMTLRGEALGRMADMADKKATQIRSYLSERVHDVRSLARREQTQQALSALSRAYLRHGPASAEYARADAAFRDLFAAHIEEGVVYDVFLISPQGDIVYSQKHEADFATSLVSGAYRETQLAAAFRESRMTLEPVLSGYDSYAPSHELSAAFISVPVLAQGVLKGVLAVQLNDERLLQVATDATGLGVSGATELAELDGAGSPALIAPRQSAAQGAPHTRTDMEAAMASPAFLALGGDTGEGVETDHRGQTVVAAWRYLPELGWGMAVKMDADEAFAPIYRQRTLMLEALSGLLLFAGLAAYYFGRQISMPLDGLARAADEVAKGNLDKRADESAPGELGVFARAFNHMAESLQGLYRTLELRIEERTRELNSANQRLQDEIAEREHTEVALRNKQIELQRNQDLLNEAQRMGRLGSWELNLVSGELRWSDEIYRMFELDPAQFAPSYESFLGVIHPADRERVNQAYTRSLQDRQPYDVVHRLQFADGRIRWVREHCSSDFDQSGKPLRSVGTVQDITEQKLAEDALRVAAATFDTHEGIMITDAQASILRVNRAFEEITGYDAAEVLGKNPRLLSSGQQDKAFYAEMWRQLLQDGNWAGEVWDRRKNGDIYPKWLTITAVKNEEGAVTEYVAIFSDITARKRAEEEIRNLAFYDALTRLPNRRLLLDRFQLALSMSARSHHCGALLFLDMDKFKTVNDTLGHDCGDVMLVEAGRRIQRCVREVDTVARLGGDEFLILIEEISTNMQEASQKAALIAEKIRAALSEPFMLKEHEVHSSTSIGVSMYRGNAESVEVLMKQADMAMYQAKDSGRNTVRFFDPLMQQAVVTRAQLEADLRGALLNRQMQLHYQVQVDGEGRPLGAEALIRWLHPQRGMVSPAQFIPIAEESSLILDIGHWVIESACRQLAEWAPDERMRHMVLAVNVSAQQFRLHDFVERLDEMIARYGIPPERLKLELTESVVLENVADVVGKMHALKALGVRLSLDDFGTGYSSLAYLKQLPLDQIKIDQSFVRGITTDQNDAVMVKAIIDMAHNFRLNVIAEGVETEAQLAFLKLNECMAFQGYLFSRPVPVAEFEALARNLLTREKA